jgi:two-component system, cell cycle sensor histidine kinase and response regulator CckA
MYKIEPFKEINETPSGAETILLIEDEEMLLDLLKTLLEEKGYKVLTARDGEEGVDVYRRKAENIALVISDMGLPKLGGWDAFIIMKAMNPKLKAILASGYFDPNLKAEMLNAGAIDFIQKPYVPDKILKKIREVIDSNPDVNPL